MKNEQNAVFEEKFKDESIELLKVQNLKNLKDSPAILLDLVFKNGFIEPSYDNIDEAENCRKQLKLGRLAVNNHVRAMSSDLRKAGKYIAEIGAELINIVEIPERKQENANQVFFQKEAFKIAEEKNNKESLEKYLSDYSKQSKIPIFQNEAFELLNKIIEKENKEALFFSAWKAETRHNVSNCNNSNELKQLISNLENTEFSDFGSNSDNAFQQNDIFLDMSDKRLILLEEKEEQVKKLAELQKKQQEEKEEQAKKDEEKAETDKQQKAFDNIEIFASKAELIEMKLEKVESSEHCNMLISLLKKDIEKFAQHENCKPMIADISEKIAIRKSELLKKEKELIEAEELKAEKFTKERELIDLKFNGLRNHISEMSYKSIADVETLIFNFKIKEEMSEQELNYFNPKVDFCKSLFEQMKSKLIEERKAEILGTEKKEMSEKVKEVLLQLPEKLGHFLTAENQNYLESVLIAEFRAIAKENIIITA